MTTINIKREMHNKILQDLGYTLIRGVWNKKVEMPEIRSEIEKLQMLKIPDIEILLY
jgi:hypothetical protein